MITGTSPLALFDTHTHVQDRSFDKDRPAVLARARSAGIERMVAIGEDRASSEAAVTLAREAGGVWAAAGVHPHHAGHAAADLEGWLRGCCASGAVVAIGEIGLDYHYDRSPRDVQRAIFRRQLDLAQRMNLPVVIHSREALDDTLSILGEWSFTVGGKSDRPLGVMHCFGYDWQAARQFLALGFMISIPGTVTFPGAESIGEVARRTPGESLVLETDAPVLAPQGHRGQRNEPAYLLETAREVALLRSTGVHALAEETTANAMRLFRLSDPVGETAGASGARA